MRFLVLATPLVALGVGYAYWRNQDAAAAAPTPKAVPMTAVLLNATLHGGNPTEKVAALSAYQASKGLPVSGIYTRATRAALAADGITNPPAAQAP